MSTTHKVQAAPPIPSSMYDRFDQINDPNGGSLAAQIDAFRHYLAGDTGDDTLTGGNNDDVLWGGFGTNHLNGRGGNDWFITGDPGSDAINESNIIDGGGGKHDTVDYSGATAAVTVDFGHNFGFVGGHNDTITGVEDAIGSIYNDVMTGDSGNNTLSGGLGADILIGGAGSDILDGRGTSGVFAPNFVPVLPDGDTASYQTSSTYVVVDLGTGTGTHGDAAGDTLRNIQNLTGSAFDDTLKGDSNANVLDGGDGSDTLKGGGGADTFNGGLNLDGKTDMDIVTFEDAKIGVKADLSTGTGTAGDGSQVKFISIAGLTGSSHGDTLTGDSEKNTLDGGDGADTLNGKGGNDTLNGDGGKDTLIGGLGSDTLTGGTENDVFKYNSIDESQNAFESNGHVKYDTITDFEQGKDTIDLSSIDADVNTDGIQHFSLAPKDTNDAGQVTFSSDGAGNTLVEAFDGANTLMFELTGDFTLKSSDFHF